MALNTSYMISPNLQEFFIDGDTGLPLSGGTVTYYKDNARSTLKPIYELTGTYIGGYEYLPLPNPMILSGVGTPMNLSGQDVRVYYYPYTGATPPVIENYYIVVKDAAGNVKLDRQAWPNLGATSTTSSTFAYNFVRNNTFYAWNNGTSFTDVKLGSASLTDFLFDDWTYENDDATQTINISRGTFGAGATLPTGNPVYYLDHQVSVAGSAAASVSRYRQTYKSVQTLNNQTVSVSIWVYQVNNGALPGQFTISMTQDFGSGGSTAVETTILATQILTIGSWVNFTGTALIPSTATKTIGTGDQLIINLNVPKNSVIECYFSSMILEQSTSISTPAEMSNDDVERNTNYSNLYPVIRTGKVITSFEAVATTGWLLMADQTIGKVGSSATATGLSYKALYNVIWNNVINTYAPIYDSSGIPTTRGGSADIDFNLSKRLLVTRTLGRVIAAAGQGILTQSFTADFNTDLITLPQANSIYYTGCPVQVVAIGSGVLPAGLAPATTYYAIPISNTTIKLATSAANALSGTPVNIIDNGTPPNEMTITYSNWTLGEAIGAESTITVPNHTHNVTTQSFAAAGVVNVRAVNNFSDNSDTVNATYTTTGPTGGIAALELFQPSIFMNYFIKL